MRMKVNGFTKLSNLALAGFLIVSSFSTSIVAETKQDSKKTLASSVLDGNAAEVSAIETYALTQANETNAGDDSTGKATVETPDENATADEIINSLTSTEETKEFLEEKESGRNPYNITQNDSKVFFAGSELLLVQNFDSKQTTTVYDTFKMNEQYDTKTSDTGEEIRYKVNFGDTQAPIANSGYDGDGSQSYQGASVTSGGVTYKSNFDTATAYDTASTNYSLVRAVAFNPFGRDRDNCVAYVALKICHESSHTDGQDFPNSNWLHADLVTWMYDFKENKKSEEVFLGTFDWDDIDDEAYFCEMLNFLAITAGDYDGDGKDSAVLYYAGRGRWRNNDTGLVELQWNENDGVISYETKQSPGKDLYADSTLIHPLYTTGGTTSVSLDNWQRSYEVYNKLTCSLDTGDFNGDGIEDLVVLTSVGEPVDKDKSNMLRYVPYLAVAYGEEGSELGSILKNKVDSTYVELKEKTEDSYTYWSIPRNPGLAVGDANGDYIDEIAVAGSKYLIKGEKNKTNADAKADSSSVYNSHDFEYMTVGIYSAKSNSLVTESLMSSIKTNTWKSSGLYNDNELPRTGIEFFRINGVGTQEQLFIDGTVYSFVTGSSIISNVEGDYTPYYFQHSDKGAGPWVSVTNTYIVSVVAGNFDGNIAGREQLMLVIGLKSSGKHNDSTAIMSIGGTYSDIVKTNSAGKEYLDYQQASGYYATNYDAREYYLNRDDDSDVEDNFCSEIVALDIDEDGYVYEYTGMEMAYTDAEVQAVVQASPRFSELNQDAGRTDYSIVTSYSSSEGSSESQGFDLSGVFNISNMTDVTPGVAIQIRMGYQYSRTNTWSKTTSKTYTASFTSTTENSVVLRRIPFYRYNYVVKNKASADSDTSIVSVMVAQAPSYTQLNVSEFNSIVDSYNDKLREKWNNQRTLTNEPTYLTKITETSLNDNEGNPWRYKNGLGGEEAETVINDHYVAAPSTGGISDSFSETPTWITLGDASGSVTVAMSENLANSTSWSTSGGWLGGFSVTGGIFFVNGGISFNVHKSTGSSGGSSSTEGSGVSTAVMNINKAALTKGNATSAATVNAYGFDWTFAAGNIKIGYQKVTNSDGITTQTPVYANYLHHVLQNVKAPVEPVKLISLNQGNDTSGNTTVTLTWMLDQARNSCNGNACTVSDLDFKVYERNESTGSNWDSLLKEGDTATSIPDSELVLNDDGTVSYTFVPSSTTQGNTYGYAIRCSLKNSAVESVNSNSISYVSTASGLSAYDLAVKQGFKGSLDDWLASLKGDTGMSAYELAKSKGYTGTEEEWLASLKGNSGTNGKDGLSAYELARSQGYDGSLSEWLASLAGKDAKSAYDIAVENGYVGDEESWAKSLQGKSTYDIYVDLNQLPADKILSLEQFTTIDTEEGITSRYQTYVEALSETDSKITPLTEDEFLSSYIKNGGAYDSFVGLSTDGKGWLNEYLTKVVAPGKGLSEDVVNKIFEELSTMTELNFSEATKGCTTVEDYAKKYVELVNIAGSNVVNPESETKWTDISLDEVIDGQTVLERALTLWKESLTLNKVYDVYTSTAKNLNSDNYSGILNEADWLDSLKNGKDGASAYEIAVEKGFKGTEEEWLASLKGTDGTSGESAYQIAVNNGYKGTVTEWLASLKGDSGSGGSNGKSAYEIAVENGFNGTVNDWLKSLIGASGTTSDSQSQAIANGVDGTDGMSAYQIAVANGYSGTVTEWLNSLVGAKGDTGATGRGIAYVKVNKEGHLIVTYTDDTYEDAGAVLIEGSSIGRDPLVYVALILALLALIMSILRYYAVYKKKHKTNE